MIKAVIFDMYETLVTLFNSKPFTSYEISKFIGCEASEYKKFWDPTEDDRTLGKITSQQGIEIALRGVGLYSKKLADEVFKRRKAARAEVYNHVDERVFPMLEELKKRGLKVALISNCFSEEAEHIRGSKFMQYFDEVFLSYELGIKKPDLRIFKLCVEKLGVAPEECLYVGDGGSRELETAREFGMKAVQACWYLKENTYQPCGRKPEFPHAEAPEEILEYTK